MSVASFVEVLGKSVEVLRFHEAAVAPAAVLPVLVFLHEGLGSAQQWRDFPARVARATALTALTYSRVGYGASASVTLPRPLTYMQDEARDFLPGLLDALSIDAAILIGHSDGGSIALVAAALDARAKRGVQSQSMDPSMPTRAAVSQSPIRA